VPRRSRSRLALIWGVWLVFVLVTGALLCADHTGGEAAAHRQICVAWNNLVVQRDHDPSSAVSPSTLLFDTTTALSRKDLYYLSRQRLQGDEQTVVSIPSNDLPILRL